jgi:hypothetical protein
MLETYPLKWMNFHPDISSLHLKRRAHSLASSPHIDRISQFRLARIDQSLRFKCLPFLCTRIFKLFISTCPLEEIGLKVPPCSAFLELIY